MIYICTHKKIDNPNYPGYAILMLGSEGKNTYGFIPDNLKDNISLKNKNYCELTGAYWIWKNSSDPIKGLVHYRRFFSNNFMFNSAISYKDCEKILNRYDVILPFERKLSETTLENYTKECGYEKDVLIVKGIIQEKYPDYIPVFNEFFKSNAVRFFNMIIARSEVFDAYSSWLFDILFELEKRTDISGYNDYQQRIYGFMSERLLNVYFLKNDYRIFECGVVPREDQWTLRKKFSTGLKRRITYLSQMYL